MMIIKNVKFCSFEDRVEKKNFFWLCHAIMSNIAQYNKKVFFEFQFSTFVANICVDEGNDSSSMANYEVKGHFSMNKVFEDQLKLTLDM